MRARYDVDTYELANTAGRGGSGVGGCLDGSNITTNDRRDKSRADLFVTYQLHVSGFDHSVRSLDHGN
jgi:hypothetical protein